MKKSKNRIAATGMLAACLLTGICLFVNLTPRIDDEWDVTLVMDGDGSILACSWEQKDTYPDAAVTNMICTAEHGTLQLEDGPYRATGTYRFQKFDPMGTVYSVSLTADDGREFSGEAAASSSLFHKGGTEQVLTMNLCCDQGSYSLFFSK